MPIAEFAYDNAKNVNTGYISFELNCGFKPGVSYKKDVDLVSKSKIADKPTENLRDLMLVYREILQYA